MWKTTKKQTHRRISSDRKFATNTNPACNICALLLAALYAFLVLNFYRCVSLQGSLVHIAKHIKDTDFALRLVYLALCVESACSVSISTNRLELQGQKFRCWSSSRYIRKHKLTSYTYIEVSKSPDAQAQTVHERYAPR